MILYNSISILKLGGQILSLKYARQRVNVENWWNCAHQNRLVKNGRIFYGKFGGPI
jgi:hypothetical protein